MAGRVTRRSLLRNAALGGAGLVLLADGRSARTYAANERVNLAIVGVSGRGSWFSDTMPKLANVVAMCDVNDRRAAPYYKAIPQAKTFRDFRKMLEEMIGRKLDWGDAGEKKWADHAGCLLVGSKGMIHSTGHNASQTVLPAGKSKDLESVPRSLPRSRGHENEWLDACRGGPAAMSNFDYSGPLTEFVLLGNVATLFGKSIEYDPVAMEVTNLAEANEAIKRQYREGWSL